MRHIASHRMRKVVYYILFCTFIVGIPLFTFGIINTMVSITYETVNPGDCISCVNGTDLCFTIKILKVLIAICVIGLLYLIVFKKRLLKQK